MVFSIIFFKKISYKVLVLTDDFSVRYWHTTAQIPLYLHSTDWIYIYFHITLIFQSVFLHNIDKILRINIDCKHACANTL